MCFLLFSIANILKDPLITKNLQKLTISIRYKIYTTWNTASVEPDSFNSCSELDDVANALRQVNIFVIIDGDDTSIGATEAFLRDRIPRWLPRTHERDVLGVEIHDYDFDEMSLEDL